jgi:hypothetical protein
MVAATLVSSLTRADPFGEEPAPAANRGGFTHFQKLFGVEVKDFVDKVRALIGPANKAFVAALVPVITVAVGDVIDAFNVAAENWVGTAVVAVLTGLGVYEVPNHDIPEVQPVEDHRE